VLSGLAQAHLLTAPWMGICALSCGQLITNSLAGSLASHRGYARCRRAITRGVSSRRRAPAGRARTGGVGGLEAGEKPATAAAAAAEGEGGGPGGLECRTGLLVHARIEGTRYA
jgi:hypothetical protein